MIWKVIHQQLLESYKSYKQTIKVGIIASAANLGYGVLNQSAVPPYVAALGWTSYIGIIYAAWLVAETTCKTPMGTLADKLGMRPIYIIAAMIGAISALLWTVVHSLWLILGIRVLDGIGSAGIWTITIVVMSETVPSEKRTTAMGVFTFTYLVGLSLGPLIGGYANDTMNSKLTSFYVASVLFAVAALLAYFVIPRRGSLETIDIEQLKMPFIAQIKLGLKAFPDYMLIAALIFFSFGLLIPVVKLFALQELGMSEFGYGILVLPVAVILAIATLTSGKLANVWGKVNSIYIGIAIAALAMYFVPIIHKPWHLAVLATIIGSGFVIGMPAWLALISDLSTAEIRGAVIGAIGTGQGVGIIIGTSLGGYLYVNIPIHILGFNLNSHYTPFIICAIGLTISAFLSIRYIKENPERYVSAYDNG